jgi:hypothetical protein
MSDEFSWSVESALWQLQHGEQETPRSDSALNYLRTRPGVVYHLAPRVADDSPMRCCGADADDLPDSDMITSDPAEVTCKGTAG